MPRSRRQQVLSSIDSPCGIPLSTRTPATSSARLTRQVERLEQGDALREQPGIIWNRRTQPLYKISYRRRVRRSKAFVLQIEIVHDLADSPH
jgi:hypothetical protein